MKYILPLILITALALSVAKAQDGDDELVFELNPFVVETSNQDGYLATNSNSGTRLSQSIKELPIPVEVITGQFIDDIGALDVTEALQFSAGLETNITSQQVGENTSNPNAFRLRGFVSEAVMRSGFKVIGATDSINIAQVDVVRGPNALLYGIGNFGGVVNYITSRPTDEFRGQVGLTIGSWDFLRVEAQARGPVAEKHGYSIGVFGQDGNSWVVNQSSEKKGVSFLWEYKPTKRTTITLESDYIFQDRTSPENPLSPPFLGSLNEGDFIDGSHFPQSVLDFDGSDVYEDPDSRKGFLRYPSNGFRYGGLDTFDEVEDTSVIINLTHNFSENLSFQAGYNYVKRDIFEQGLSLSYSKSLQSILTNTAIGALYRQAYPWMYLPQHPNYDDWATPEFQALSYNWNQSQNVEERNQFRTELVYTKEIKGIRNSIIVGMTMNSFLPNQGASYDLKDRSRSSVPITNSDQSGLQGARNRFQSIFNYEPIRFEPTADEEWVQTTPYTLPSKFWEKGYYLIHQAKFWRDKFNTVLGVRYDSIDTANGVYWNFTDDGFTEDRLGTIKEYRHRADGPSTDINTSIGVSYSVNKNISVFVLRASALQPIYNQTDPTGNIPDPQIGLSYELGIKADFLDNKISGSASFYQIERDGVPVRTGANIYSRDDPDDPNGDPDWFAQGRGDSVDFGFKQDISRGIDMQIFVTNIIQGFQSVFNVSYNEYEWERLYGPSFVRKEGSGENAEFIFEEIDISETINQNRKHNDTPEYTVRIWNKYTFGEGKLDGLSLGLGFNWTAEREATFSPSRETLKIIPAQTVWSAAISYSTKWKDHKVSTQLNIYNLTDEQGVAGYNFITPINYRASVNVRF